MRGSMRSRRVFSAPELLVGAGLVFICVLPATRAVGADLDGYGAPPPPRVVVQSPCRLVPMPEANLTGGTERFRPTQICLSRGLYADSMPPPPPLPRPWWWW